MIFFHLLKNIYPWEECKGNIDKLLQQRRTLEFTLFKHIELQYVQPIIDKGFDSVDNFIWQANSITNRRKSRTGKSLEHNLSSIFNSENILFDTQCITENRKKPDFLFPSGEAYHNKNYPVNNLNMLGAKTVVKIDGDKFYQKQTESKSSIYLHYKKGHLHSKWKKCLQAKSNWLSLTIIKNAFQKNGEKKYFL